MAICIFRNCSLIYFIIFLRYRLLLIGYFDGIVLKLFSYS